MKRRLFADVRSRFSALGHAGAPGESDDYDLVSIGHQPVRCHGILPGLPVTFPAERTAAWEKPTTRYWPGLDVQTRRLTGRIAE
jgi:hypothetical protein